MNLPLTFLASVIPGAGRGKAMGTPTINVDLSAVPLALEEGIYACTIQLDENTHKYMGAMHYGPRPVFDNSSACEVHILDEMITVPPGSASITVVQYLREIRNFPSVEELQQQIQKDIDRCRSILSSL